MSYKSVLVNIDIDGPIAPVVTAATDLARRHKAKLIGLCAADAPLPMTAPEGGPLAAEAWLQMRDEIGKHLKEVQAEFFRLTAGAAKAEWRDGLANPTLAVVEASRSADLVVMAAREGASTGDSFRIADPASVVLRAGRPVLVVARLAAREVGRKVVVAWKDTREARRALADAIPLLASAEEVTMVTVAAELDQPIRDGMADAAAFLAGHGIAAGRELIESRDESLALLDFIETSGADLVVSGAYGHSRLREWVFGGVTRSLLDETGIDRFMSS